MSKIEENVCEKKKKGIAKLKEMRDLKQNECRKEEEGNVGKLNRKEVRMCISILTPWCRVLLEKLTGFQLVNKFPAFQGTRRFITALTSVHDLSIPWASPIQSIYPHPTSWRSILILSIHLRLGLPSSSFPPVSPPRPYTHPSPHSYVPHAQPISFFSILSPAQLLVIQSPPFSR